MTSTISHYFDRSDAMLAGIAVFHIFMAPYTKVEESFNVQAMHDLLYHRGDLQMYDHFQFPGVVPRTFLGPIFVSLLASPIVIGSQVVHLPKLSSLYIVRLVLGGVVLGTLHQLRRQITKQLGKTTSTFYTIVTFTQFHILFYCSRPLPNVFALALVNLAFSYWLRGSPKSTLRILVLTAAIFRCDVVVLLAPVGLSVILNKSLSWRSAVKCCIAAGFLAIGLSVAIDSMLWQRWTWPEFEVLWFNSVENRSAEWGVSPPHWYFTSALPRVMLVGYPLALVGVFLERRTVLFVLPVLSFIALYSVLPHKEVRFILMGVPVLNIAAAAAVARIYNNRKKPLWDIAYASVLLMLFASFCISAIMAAASYVNYPGGHALHILHSKGGNTTKDSQVHVHIGTLPAMTGISRFCEAELPWSYSKEEGLLPADLAGKDFTFLLNEEHSIPGFDCLMGVIGFSHLRLRATFPPIELVREPKVFILGSTQSRLFDRRKWQGCD